MSGVQRYAREIVRALDQRPGAADRYVLLTHPGADSLNLRNIPTRKIGRAGGHLWEQTALAWTARHGRLLSLGGSGPVLHRQQIVVIHDAAVFRHPEHFRTGYAAFHRALNRILARRARGPGGPRRRPWRCGRERSRMGRGGRSGDSGCEGRRRPTVRRCASSASVHLRGGEGRRPRPRTKARRGVATRSGTPDGRFRSGRGPDRPRDAPSRRRTAR